MGFFVYLPMKINCVSTDLEELGINATFQRVGEFYSV